MSVLFIRKYYFLLLCAFLSVCLMFLVAAKIFFTPAGYDSIGRIFHYYINYDDFGFVKRGLWGTFLKYLGVTSFLENKYIEYLVLYLTMAVVFVTIFWCYFSSKTPEKLSKLDMQLAIIIVLSPAMFLHLGYSLDNFDPVLMIFFILCIVGLEKDRILTISIVSSVAILIHEIYLFTSLPFLIWRVLETHNVKSAVKFSILPVIASLSLLLWGKLEMSKEAYLFQIENISPILLNRSGFFELTSSVSRNINMGIADLTNQSSWTLTLTAAIYVLLTYMFLQQYIERNKVRYFILGSVGCFTPLILSIVATDVYRWVSFTVFNLFVFMLIYRKKHVENSSDNKRLVIFLMMSLFVLMGPMGNSHINIPFPIFQRIFDIY